MEERGLPHIYRDPLTLKNNSSAGAFLWTLRDIYEYLGIL